MPEQPASSQPSNRKPDPLAKFPPDVRAAYARFRDSGDQDALDTVGRRHDQIDDFPFKLRELRLGR